MSASDAKTEFDFDEFDTTVSDDDLRELADVTGDDTYTRVLGDRDITSY